MALSGFLARPLGAAAAGSGRGQERGAALAPTAGQGPRPAAVPGALGGAGMASAPGTMTSYLRSFWLRKPSFIFSTTLASIELASFAKSRSRISDTGTETMAKASLSSLVGHVPSWGATGKEHHTDRAALTTSHHLPPAPGEASDPFVPSEGLGWALCYWDGLMAGVQPPQGSSGYLSPGYSLEGARQELLGHGGGGSGAAP